MRLVRSVQFALGFAAVGGAFMLSGNALAADGSSVTNTQSNGLSPTLQVDQSTQTTSSGQSGTTAGSDINNGPLSGSVVGSDGSNSSDQGSGVGVTTGDQNGNLDGQSGVPANLLTGTSTESSAQKTTTLLTTVSKDGSDNSNSNVTGSTQTGASNVPESSTPLPEQPKASTPSVPVIVYNSRILAVQPTMLNPVVGPAGLAPIVPIQPAPAKSPVPPKPDGVLVSLTQLLQATVVPASYTPTLGTVYLPGLALSLITLVVLLGSLVVATYGVWLKKGGFVTAARSDAPLSAITSMIFATPYRLGYAPASPHSHSPSFLVADDKTRTNWFPTL